MKVDYLIIGAGITGLSCARKLEKCGRNYLVLEKENKIGGLCGSFYQDGFTFDWSGHLLHLHTREGKTFVKKILQGNLNLLRRNSWIYSNGTFTRYPFQANTFGLPSKIVSECVSGFIKAWAKKRAVSPNKPFAKWADSVFGRGICRHFMYPYNKKLWQTSLNKLTARWCGAFVPRPKLEEVISGAYGPQKKKFGYNPTFYYPRKGGIGALCNAMADGVKNIRLSSALKKIDLKNKIAWAENIGPISYKKIINTMPLKEFLGRVSDCPAEIKKSAKLMKFVSVYALNLGVNRAVSDKHWIYFPEDKFPFYRVGVASNFSR
ncbi:MAG: FAD-dependent oxidoreductase, partial [Elusimicrobia bacterium]|nr:FAD-dependent oxidoreductase [Elusimicrobiota bacterium]